MAFLQAGKSISVLLSALVDDLWSDLNYNGERVCSSELVSKLDLFKELGLLSLLLVFCYDLIL